MRLPCSFAPHLWLLNLTSFWYAAINVINLSVNTRNLKQEGEAPLAHILYAYYLNASLKVNDIDAATPDRHNSAVRSLAQAKGSNANQI